MQFEDMFDWTSKQESHVLLEMS